MFFCLLGNQTINCHKQLPLMHQDSSQKWKLISWGHRPFENRIKITRSARLSVQTLCDVGA